MQTRFDHAVVVVDSLAGATAAFRDAGFTVTPGGGHDVLPTENALVAFADGAYLELLAFREPSARAELRSWREGGNWEAHLQSVSALARRFLPRLAGPGGVGDAVITGHKLARFAAESRKREFVMTGPVPMRRERKGAEPLAWELLLPAEDAIPFLIEDGTPRAWRVPGAREATTHANGARGIAEIELGARKPATLAMRFADLFDAKLSTRKGRSCATFAGVDWWIDAAESADTVGARGVRLAGVRTLPAAIEALGVRGVA